MRKYTKGKLYPYSPPLIARPQEPRISPEEAREQSYRDIREGLGEKRLALSVKINIGVCVGLILLFMLGFFVMSKPTYSEVEKRDLATFPEVSAETLFSGTLTRGIETWFADTFPLREGFVTLSSHVKEMRGLRFDDVRIIQPPAGGGEAQDMPSLPELTAPKPAVSSSEGEDPASSEEALPPPPQDVGEGTVSNGIFVYNGMAMSMYGGSQEAGRQYAQVISEYQQALPDVQVYNLIIPTAIEFYVPEKYSSVTNSQKEMIDYIYSQFDATIKTVDAYSEIRKHTDEYLYFRTDHHWTGRGAYYAYVAFCQQAGFTPINLESVETRRLDDFIGTMYSQAQDSTLLKNPDYVDYYIFDQDYTALRYVKDSPYYGVETTLWGEYAQGVNSYSVFLHGDFPLLTVKTNNTNGRKILVVKESFGNAFAPFLINHYEEVHIVDQRYFQLNLISYIQQNGINELIFANNSFAACTPYHIQCISNLRYQTYTPPVQQAAAPPEEEEVGGDEQSPADNEDGGVQVQAAGDEEDDD